MAFDDLRSFLQELDDHGQLLKISEEVNAEPDLAAAANATGRIGDGAPALWFDNIRGFTDARVAMNTIGSWQNHAISLGLPPNAPVKKQIDEFIRRWDNFPIAPERRANPAWAQNTVDGEEINLFDILPLFRLNDGDGGFYLDKACVVSRDPLDPDNFGKQNVGIYRMEVKGKRKLGLQGMLQIAPFHPRFQFAGTDEDDITNATNRAPYPTLHLIREASIDRAVAAFPEAEAIYEANMATLEKLGDEGWAALGVGASAPQGSTP